MRALSLRRITDAPRKKWTMPEGEAFRTENRDHDVVKSLGAYVRWHDAHMRKTIKNPQSQVLCGYWQ